jgi:hypothetical protein
MKKKFTLVLHDGNKAYKIVKIAFYGNGGFCIFAPYHSAKKGLLVKLKFDYRLRNQNISRDECLEYTADDKVKLSLHPDGFVQFSGLNKNIISGRDKVTGKPKGLGLMSNPLNQVIKSGPTFGITLWGINEFNEYIKSEKDEQIIEFQESDYYYRNCTKDWNGYIIEGFLFERNVLPYVIKVQDKQLLKIKHFNFEIPGTIFIHRIIPYYSKDYIIGLIISRTKIYFESKSGFILNSPSQIVDKTTAIGLFALYPPDSKMILPQQSLNYLPNKL